MDIDNDETRRRESGGRWLDRSQRGLVEVITVLNAISTKPEDADRVFYEIGIAIRKAKLALFESGGRL